MRAGQAGPAFLNAPAFDGANTSAPVEDFRPDIAPGPRRSRGLPTIRWPGWPRLAPSGSRGRIEQEVDREIQEAFDFAESSPFPEDAELFTDLYK